MTAERCSPGSASAWFVVGFSTMLFLTSALVFAIVWIGRTEDPEDRED